MTDKIYCTRPFDHIQMLDNGEMVPCCPPWVNHYSLGNINEQSYEEIWNGEKAQEFRESILDGSFRYCNIKSCPHLQEKSNPVGTLDQLKEKKVSGQILHDIVEHKTILDHGPHEIQFAYDRSCNLSCPSCRRGIIMVAGEEQKKLLDMQDKFQTTFLKNADRLFVCGSGDPFASPTFRKFLQTFTKEQAPKLRHINILTNGLLLKKYWDRLSEYTKEKIQYISVSIDAATPETYAINRRGGDWDLLHENLKFIRKLRKNNTIKGFNASMVVQDNNFRELFDFILMCETYKMDRVQLQIIEPDFIRDLGYGDYLEEWKQKAVHEKTHPNHSELLNIVKDDFFSMRVEKESVAMGPLYNLREGHDISQYDELLKEEAEIKKKADKFELVKKGVLKDIWFEKEMYFVEIESIKSIDDTDVVRLDNGKTVKWDKDGWVEI